LSDNGATGSGAAKTVRPELVEGRMGDAGPRIDALIDEALRDLTAGTPRDGLRGRVLARIAATSEPQRRGDVVVLGWRVQRFQLATAGALAALGLAALFLLPSLVHRGGLNPAETTTAAHAPSSPAAEPASQGLHSDAERQTQVARVAVREQPRRSAIQRSADTLQARAADEEPSAITRVKVAPLPDPDPIVNRAIEIKPVEIEELAIPEIQVRPLDAGRAKLDDK
jgi:hypothetical protein